MITETIQEQATATFVIALAGAWRDSTTVISSIRLSSTITSGIGSNSTITLYAYRP